VPQHSLCGTDWLPFAWYSPPGEGRLFLVLYAVLQTLQLTVTVRPHSYLQRATEAVALSVRRLCQPTCPRFDQTVRDTIPFFPIYYVWYVSVAEEKKNMCGEVLSLIPWILQADGSLGSYTRLHVLDMY